MKNPIVTITMENGGVIKAELYPEVAPNTVNNFVDLVNRGFYDGLIFHRVIPGFMIQGGCPEGTGTGGPGYSIKGEFTSNGFKNDLKHSKGVLSMARAMHPDSAGSQFFIMVADAPHLDGQYASFGKVIEGMDEADKIVKSKRDVYDRPYEDQVIKTMTVDMQGESFKEPEIIEE
ncbi:MULTISPECIES: peptidylprolyl isomerase [Clostridium]|jgi:peptidyl-prolyl cis-trans isomerase B (cyclophilin B)|uniref:Peptidyl-prolyl cis-trans isomerase n=2 Tax=Clostridium butyricum TaxID=1492 RepID=C4IMF8_CLOBU|nr:MULTISPECIES: peptidylprolyl isomerase [Clostridium]ETI91775.1 MAG: Peptidyl-prolyl cis-trans isomerase [Clostridium butyricum DORA_1]ALP88925.1 peptidylprolyl isomerase [Clostridium butyricum]ALS15389.1 peptidylprolyl isomerase [Clostridium butyricum]ANF12538.1 peptidylprolyl isomerase [Clostridium butyricum]AOR92607.1 peptidylprolyl isomerase [Clostridium butyricum]